MCDYSIDNYTQIIGYTDTLTALRFLFSYPMTNWVSQYFTRTRSSEAQLRFVEICRIVVEQNADRIEPFEPVPVSHFGPARKGEYERFDRSILGHEFCAYDRLNRWSEYINLFEKTRREKQYIDTFLGFRDDPVFNSYIIRSDWKYKYVHFLYIRDRRYKIICRKQERMMAGKNVEHLKRHQQNRLSDDDLAERNDEMVRLFEFIRQKHSGQAAQ